MKHFIFGFLWCFMSIQASANIAHRADVKTFIQEMVTEYHFSQKSLEDLFSKVEIQQSIIDAMNRPAEGKDWYEYRPLFVSPESIRNGVTYYQTHKAALSRAEKTYGVPAELIVAIIGVETRYGRNKGSYSVIDALSTLSFEYPKRAPFFRSELKEYLLLTREEELDPLSLKGSYAGAMGISQFMPSSYRRYAVDFANDGHRNIWSNDVDAIGSVANYFKGYGWKTAQPVAFPVTVSKDNQFGLTVIEPETPVSTFKAQGVKGIDQLSPETLATVLAYQGRNGKEYWLTLHNFYVITRYNKSPQYALAVYELSQEIGKRVRKN